MKIPEPLVRIVHRLMNLRDGEIVIRKSAGAVVEVRVDGRVLKPWEWLPAGFFHVEQSPPGGVPRGTLPDDSGKNH